MNGIKTSTEGATLFCAAPSVLAINAVANPGLTAGPIHCRLFEAPRMLSWQITCGISRLGGKTLTDANCQ